MRRSFEFLAGAITVFDRPAARHYRRHAKRQVARAIFCGGGASI